MTIVAEKCGCFSATINIRVKERFGNLNKSVRKDHECRIAAAGADLVNVKIALVPGGEVLLPATGKEQGRRYERQQNLLHISVTQYFSALPDFEVL